MEGDITRLILTYIITLGFMVVFGITKMLGELNRDVKDLAYFWSNLIVAVWVASTWVFPTSIIHDQTGISGEISGSIWLILLYPLFAFHVNVFERKIWLSAFKKMLMIHSND